MDASRRLLVAILSAFLRLFGFVCATRFKPESIMKRTIVTRGRLNVVLIKQGTQACSWIEPQSRNLILLKVVCHGVKQIIFDYFALTLKF